MQWYLVVILNVLLLYKNTSFAFFEHGTANQKCQIRGGLLPYDDFVNGNGFILLNNERKSFVNLKDGESAWISGMVKFSKFLSWYGCFENLQSVRKYLYDNNVNFTKCFEFCDTYNNTMKVSYVGLKNKNCFCITTENITKSTTVDKSACSPVYPYHINDYNGSNERATSVFQIHNDLTFQTYDLQQCVHAKSVSRAVRYGTSSCYTTEKATGGFICTNDAKGKLNNSCKQFFQDSVKSPPFCLQHNKLSWMKAKTRCSDYSGKLVSQIVSPMLYEMKNRLTYWTGIFRSFKITEDRSRENDAYTACLAVTRVGERLVMDPDNCSSRKKYLCSDWTWNTKTTTSTHSVPTETPEAENKKHEEIYIIVVALVFVSVLAIIVYLIFRRFYRIKHHVRQYENVSASGENNEYIEIPYEGEETNDVHAQQLQKNTFEQVKPKKPLRHTLRKQHKTSTYENCKLNVSEESNFSPNAINKDYDKVDFKLGKRNNADSECIEKNHIYNHTTARIGSNGEEEYDRTLSVKSDHQLDPSVYNTLEKTFKNIEKLQRNADIENDSEVEAPEVDLNAS